MAKNLEQIIQKIPLERQKKIEERASELIVEEMTNNIRQIAVYNRRYSLANSTRLM